VAVVVVDVAVAVAVAVALLLLLLLLKYLAVYRYEIWYSKTGPTCRLSGAGH